MAVIRKLSSNRFQLDFVLFGHRMRTNFFEENQALDFRKRLLAVIPEHQFTIEQAIKTYLRNETDKRKIKRTRIMERFWFYEMRAFLKDSEGFTDKTLISEVNRFHLNEFQTKLVERGSARGRVLSHSSINRRFHTIKNFFARLHEWGFIAQNPAEYVRQLPEQINRRKKWTDEDVQAALGSSALTPLEVDIFKFLLRTGVRLGSLCAIRVRDVFLEKNVIIVRQRKGNGAEHDYTIPIPPALRELVARRLSDRRDDFLFRDDRGRGLYAGYYSKRFQRAFARAGLEHLKLHGLRHTFASRLSAAGASTEAIRRLLGHRSGKTTENYLQLDIEHLQKLVA